MLYIVQGALAEINPGVTAEDFLRPILTGTQPGVVEELFYRGIVFGGLMHFRAGKKNRVLVACLASTLVFSLTHMVNMIDGQSFIGTVNQLLFAFAVGGHFCASYLRSHNLWAPLFFHALHDSFAFFLVRTISGASTDGAPTLASILVDVLVLAYACYIIFSTKQETVDALWGAAKEEAEEEKEELVEEVSEI